jgi:hypothetical protein
MRVAIAVALGLTLSTLTSTAQAGPAESDFASMRQCENYLDRWRSSLQRPNAGSMGALLAIYEAAYCEQSANGRFNVVWPG